MRRQVSQRAGLLCSVLLCALLTSACSNLVSIEANGATVDLGPQLQTSVVVDADGGVLAELHAEQDRDLVALAQIPLVVRQAVVAVEDARFYQHPGVDTRAIARALVTNLVEGDIRQGGSTITQQLIKNAVVGDAQTLDRKLTEASLALQLEAQLTKDEILERYLNTVYFGNGAYGIGAAARVYFDIDVSQIGLGEAALLAGMLRAPSHYDPYGQTAAAIARRDLVIGLMVDQGYATDDQAARVTGSPLAVVPRSDLLDWRHPYVVDHALDALQHDPAFHVLGATASERASRLFGGGLRIETTMDPQVQVDAERAIDAVLTDPTVDPRAALVAIDPASGAITALVGGRDYTDQSDPVARFNLATDGRRQPGSSFKPLVLAAALEAGWSLEDTVPAPATIMLPLGNGTSWTVTNSGDQAYDDLTLRTATALSVNVVYAQLIRDVGAPAVIEVANRAGIRSPLSPLLSLSLGAQEVSPLEMASVTATFAAQGVYHPPTIISRITDADGVAIWQNPQSGQQVIDPQIAREVGLAMQDVVDAGTGVAAALGRPTAGKTGTSQDNADAWFTGFTPDLAAAVWIGFPEGRVAMVPPRTRTVVQGGGWPAEIFARFGVAALADVVATPFTSPDGDLVTVQVDLTRDCLPNDYTPRNLIGERGYVAGTEPTEVCAEPAGPPTVDVPMVEGMRVEQATQALNVAGFSVIEQPEYSPSLPPGTVLSQEPAAGASQLLSATGFVARLTVASGDRTGTVVPDVLNRSLDVMRQTLEAQGFGVRVRVECPDGGTACTGSDARPGTVWQQQPEAGTRVPVNALVTVWAYPA